MPVAKRTAPVPIESMGGGSRSTPRSDQGRARGASRAVGIRAKAVGTGAHQGIRAAAGRGAARRSDALVRGRPHHGSGLDRLGRAALPAGRELGNAREAPERAGGAGGDQLEACGDAATGWIWRIVPGSCGSEQLADGRNADRARAGVYVIEGPMGCGKTEAALAAAYQLISAGKAAGLYFALPTQVTSNRIHLRVQPFVERISEEPATVRLAHAASWLVETKPPLELRPAGLDVEAREHVRAGRSWFAFAKRALLAPFGVGTIDQALLGIVAAKHF